MKSLYIQYWHSSHSRALTTQTANISDPGHPMKQPCLPIIVLFAIASLATCAENAAQARFGARIDITCAVPTPLNARYAGVSDLLKEKSKGPIINGMATAMVTICFPVPLTVRKIGLRQMGHKTDWTRATKVDVMVDDLVVHTLTLDVDNQNIQLLDVTTVKTDKLILQVKEVGPDGAKVAYGGFSAVQVIVDEDLATLLASPQAGEKRPAFAMTTPNLGSRPPVTVIGKPRKETGYPRTIWDPQDIIELKRRIATEPAAKDAYERCLTFCNQSVAKPVEVPEKPDEDIDATVANGHTMAVGAIANLGIGYALSGDERYAKEVRRMLLRYSELYEGWPVHGSPKFRHDKSKWSWQRLNESIWLIQAAWGYDLIYASPSLSDADRAQISNHFIKPCVDQIVSSPAIIALPTNFSAICCAAVMIGSRVSDYEEKYLLAINGLAKTRMKAKKGEAQPPMPAPTPSIELKTDVASGNNGGIFFHIDKGIDDDGLWAEGAIGYQMMAMRGLVVMAEILWHDGVDVYGYRNGRLKLIFDSAIWYCYPGGSSSPAIHDSGSVSLFGRDAHIYQYAMRRYGDPAYNAILSRITPSLASVYNLFLPAFTFAPVQATDLPPNPSILFPGVGFAISRTGNGEDQRYLLMDYGPNRSHGHPDKLNFCLFALGQELYADGGSAWYSTDIYKYYSHTLAHNTVLANGLSQINTTGRLEAYCQAGNLTLIRASCDSAIPSTGLDRTLVMLGNRLYDIYHVHSKISSTVDLPLHSYGALTPSTEIAAGLKPWEAEQRNQGPYVFLDTPRITTTDGNWSSTWQLTHGSMRLHAIGEKDTGLIFATSPKGGSKLGTVIMRRQTSNTVYAMVSDVIPEGSQDSVRAVEALRSDTAYGLDTTLTDGINELVLTNQGTGPFKLGNWSSDASVAILRHRGSAVAGLIISGGTALNGPGLDITLSVPGLISVYAVKDGLYRCTNHGDMDNMVTWPGLPAKQCASLDANGAWIGVQPITGGRFNVPAGSAVDLSSEGEVSVAAFESTERKAKQKAAWDAEQHRLTQQATAMLALRELASKEAVPASYVVLIEAETLSAQGKGEATFPTNKVAAHGASLSGWTERRHWLEYVVDIAHTGWYQVGIKYCLEGDSSLRSLHIDGKAMHDDIEVLNLPGTGGWSSGADQWALLPIALPGSEVPMLVRLEAGKHTIRMENVSGGGMNVDYLVLMSANVTMTRSLAESR